MACTITNLPPLGHPCTPQMGGLKYVYLAVGGPSAHTANPNQSIHLTHDLWASVGLDLPSEGLWGLTVENGNNFLVGCAAYEWLVSEGWASGDIPVYRIALTRQQAVITSEATVNRENNTVFYANSVVIPTLGLTPEAVTLVRRLGQGGVVVIGETYDGRLVAFGFEERATLAAASLTTGAAFGDNPGATITLTANESIPVCADACWLDDEALWIGNKDQCTVKILTDYGFSA